MKCSTVLKFVCCGNTSGHATPKYGTLALHILKGRSSRKQ